MSTLRYERITLIGMAGVGKTSFGSHVAQEHGFTFVDTDTVLEARIKTSLYEFVKLNGENAFLELEELIPSLLSITDNMIIATGGSVIYSDQVMNFLRSISTIVYLKDSIENIKQRVTNFKQRAVIMRNHSTLESMYKERLKLYDNWADVVVEFEKTFSFTKNLITLYDHIT